MSKFSKPKTATEADIERVIQRADAVDNQRSETKASPSLNENDIRFTMTLTGDMAGRVDQARRKAGGLTRLSWIRLAVAEKLVREGL